MQILNIEQGGADWKAARCGILSASVMSCLLVDGKGKCGFGAAAFTLMNEIIGERFTGVSSDDFNGNFHTSRGHDLEPIARAFVSERLGIVIDEVGIILNHGVGYSPDGVVGNDGLVEIKTKLPKLQIEVILSGEIPKEHIVQCQAGLWISERDHIDFASFWPGMPLFHKRAGRDEVMIAKLAERVATFYELMEERTQQIIDLAV
jgi:predicted phage-related endonuclease